MKKFVERNRFYVPVAMDSEDSESSENEVSESTDAEEDEAQEEFIEPEPEVLGRGRRVRKAKRFFDKLGED